MKRAEAIKELKDVLESVKEKPSAPHFFAHSEVLALQTIVALAELEEQSNGQPRGNDV